jgi:hypothetical protein
MRVFQAFVFFMMSLMLINQYAPMIGDHYRAKEAAEKAAVFQAKQEASRKARMCAELPFLRVCKPPHHVR